MYFGRRECLGSLHIDCRSVVDCDTAEARNGRRGRRPFRSHRRQVVVVLIVVVAFARLRPPRHRPPLPCSRLFVVLVVLLFVLVFVGVPVAVLLAVLLSVSSSVSPSWFAFRRPRCRASSFSSFGVVAIAFRRRNRGHRHVSLRFVVTIVVSSRFIF